MRKSWQQYLWENLPTKAISDGEDTSREFLPAHVVACDITHPSPDQEPLPRTPGENYSDPLFAVLYWWERRRLWFTIGDSLLIGWRVDQPFPGDVPQETVDRLVATTAFRQFNADARNTPDLLLDEVWVPIPLDAYPELQVRQHVWEYVRARVQREGREARCSFEHPLTGKVIPVHPEHLNLRTKDRVKAERVCQDHVLFG